MEKNKRLTDEELQEIRERVEKASAKPWAVVTDELGGQAKAVIDGDNWDIIRRPYVGKDNAAFIAHARQDIPKLLAEIERLEAENKALKEESSEYSSIALWSARRLATREYAEYVYDEIEKVYGYAVDRDWRGEQV